MSEKTVYSFDDDVADLVGLLLRSFAKENKDFRRYDRINQQMAFKLANRGLVALGLSPEPEWQAPETTAPETKAPKLA